MNPSVQGIGGKRKEQRRLEDHMAAQVPELLQKVCTPTEYHSFKYLSLRFRLFQTLLSSLFLYQLVSDI